MPVFLLAHGEDSMLAVQSGWNKELETRTFELEKQNALLSQKIDLIVADNDKRLSLFCWSFGIIMALLLTIYAIGSFRANVTAKQEARKSFNEAFEETKVKMDQLKAGVEDTLAQTKMKLEETKKALSEAEKMLVEIATVKELAEQEVAKRK